MQILREKIIFQIKKKKNSFEIGIISDACAKFNLAHGFVPVLWKRRRLRSLDYLIWILQMTVMGVGFGQNYGIAFETIWDLQICHFWIYCWIKKWKEVRRVEITAQAVFLGSHMGRQDSFRFFFFLFLLRNFNFFFSMKNFLFIDFSNMRFCLFCTLNFSWSKKT